ncbi:MAG: phosphotransferase [Tepidiphilus sp.]|nr:phosphotransferase [Tepidiphilus sp.]
MDRSARLRHWLADLGIAAEPRPASADASFRRYWRVALPDAGTRIVMDAPPDKEPVGPWLAVQRLLHEAGVAVPRVEAVDAAEGFVLMEDFGDRPYAGNVPLESAHERYAQVLGALATMQALPRPDWLPEYDREKLLAELRLFPEWYLRRHLGVTLTASEETMLERLFEALVARALAQPRVFVHRDYHSRNLMLLDEGRGPGVLDFQDAVWGPITYDAVSLFKDAYVDLTEEFALDLLVRYWQVAKRLGLPIHTEFEAFYTDYEWMGVQRHLKVLGIFARLAHRDGKTRYLDDLPRVRRHLLLASRRYGELAPLRRLLERLHPEELAVGYTF